MSSPSPMETEQNPTTDLNAAASQHSPPPPPPPLPPEDKVLVPSTTILSLISSSYTLHIPISQLIFV
jgi:hypothetical protein